ncbi:hypothetical protein TIFTF001_014661 [Ficus carica]|uniref:Beta-1,3-N-Acetylglucosaminyltransferase family protein n=1 Tax=Ficus carica TaxID=3494 RepID=A0AA88A469_FICCA|nr:hypothetical protein TIFTF001_014661 [Ficus carica]
MAAIMKFLCLVLVFITLIVGGNGDQCSIEDIKIEQSPTGAKVESKAEWSVVIKNECVCSQANIQLDCIGFQTVKKVDPSILSVNGDHCLVNNGLPVYGFKSISFTYAWEAPFPFDTSSSQIACS